MYIPYIHSLVCSLQMCSQTAEQVFAWTDKSPTRHTVLQQHNISRKTFNKRKKQDSITDTQIVLQWQKIPSLKILYKGVVKVDMHADATFIYFHRK